MSRSHFTAEQRLAHLSSWKKSGESKSEYCKRQGIKQLTFNKWIYKTSGLSSDANLKVVNSRKKFIPIRLTASPDVSEQLRTTVEIEFPDGTKLRIN